MKATRRKGFAIVLVAALAGLIFLLGASLVVVSQLQTASANYDQRVRLAREHARASLDMAIAELQDKLGKDTSVSYLADVYRDEVGDDFKDPSETATGNVRQPFWTAALKGSTESWLVTKPIDSDFNGTADAGLLADPEVDEFADSVTLVGEATVGEGASLLEVRVPRESIQIDEVDGFTDARTIGHYAYWVGDLGTKGSYALYDKTGQVTHDEYTAEKRNRLRQLRLAKPAIELVDTDDVSATPTNPARIDSFSSDFQFRERFGGSSETEIFLEGLTDTVVKTYFHDFTPLSKGLLVNSASDGDRVDLSVLGSISDTGYNEKFLPYATLAKSAVSTAVDYDDHRFPVQVSGPPIVPVITQFNLNYSVYMSNNYDVGAGGVQSADLYVSFAAAVELWNPYTSELDLAEGSLVLEMQNLPELAVSLYGAASPIVWQEELGALPIDLDSVVVPSFEILSIGKNNNSLRAGQIAVYSGPKALDATGESLHPLLFGPDQIGLSTDRVVFSAGSVSLNSLVENLTLKFRDGTSSVFPDFGVKIYYKDDDELTLLATYDLPEDYFLTNYSDLNVTEVGIPSFGFSWNIDDSVLYPNNIYHPLVSNPIPTEGLSDLVEVGSYSADLDANREPVFFDADLSASGVLLGYNHTDFEETLDTKYDIPVLQLPKQELGAVAQLSGAYGTSWVTPRLGDVGSAENDLLDSFFYSTVPSGWDASKTLPNTGYVPVPGAVEADLTASDSADSLFVHGMFNVHSTSIDAWAAMLKGCPASKHPYWQDVLAALEDDGDATLDTELYLFFNYPLGGEDSNAFPDPDDLPVAGSKEALRASLKQNVIALTEAQVELLAKTIVSNIRKRVQGVAPYTAASNKGPFLSLKDFADSGVIRDAIVSNSLNPGWVVAGTSAELRQSTVLNLIGAYLSVRSDTFLVRAYGDAVDPASAASNPKIWARAYCEAVVQRVHAEHGAGTLGREFKVVAFHWLSPSEI